MCMADTAAMADERSGTERVREVCAVLSVCRLGFAVCGVSGPLARRLLVSVYIGPALLLALF